MVSVLRDWTCQVLSIRILHLKLNVQVVMSHRGLQVQVFFLFFLELEILNHNWETAKKQIPFIFKGENVKIIGWGDLPTTDVSLWSQSGIHNLVKKYPQGVRHIKTVFICFHLVARTLIGTYGRRQGYQAMPHDGTCNQAWGHKPHFPFYLPGKNAIPKWHYISYL